MALSSGGNKKWRRKRGTAARLRPVGIDPAATTRLFDDGGPAGPPRRERAGRTRRAPALPTPPTPPPHSEHPAPGTGPLVRYEWRTTTGETLVVEAGWPAPAAFARPDPVAGPDGTTAGEPFPAPASAARPRPPEAVPVDLRA